jgi:hypothetical protein
MKHSQGNSKDEPYISVYTSEIFVVCSLFILR